MRRYFGKGQAISRNSTRLLVSEAHVLILIISNRSGPYAYHNDVRIILSGLVCEEILGKGQFISRNSSRVCVMAS